GNRVAKCLVVVQPYQRLPIWMTVDVGAPRCDTRHRAILLPLYDGFYAPGSLQLALSHNLLLVLCLADTTASSLQVLATHRNARGTRDQRWRLSDCNSGNRSLGALGRDKSAYSA